MSMLHFSYILIKIYEKKYYVYNMIYDCLLKIINNYDRVYIIRVVRRLRIISPYLLNI